jgi:homoserine kinase
VNGSASAPASSGNLGPGFDCLALALDLRCHVAVEPADAWSVVEAGGTWVPHIEDMVMQAAVGAGSGPYRISIDNRIPRSRGLGSSSAVTAAIAAAVMRVSGGETDRDRVFEIVADIEGHADNAAAAVYGGLVVAGGATVRHLELNPHLRVVVAIPDYPLKTSEARAALPGEIARPVVARNLARLGFLIDGLRTADAVALRAAGGDELHELPRAGLSPLTGELIGAALDAGALHACWSGAGPTALAITTDDARDKVVEALRGAIAGRGTVESLEIATDGVL